MESYIMSTVSDMEDSINSIFDNTVPGSLIGKELVYISNCKDLPITKQDHGYFGEVNLYHEDAFNYLFKRAAAGIFHVTSLARYAKDIPKLPITEQKSPLSKPIKYCKKCDKVKPVTEFRKNSKRDDGYTAWCINCLDNQTNNLVTPIEHKSVDNSGLWIGIACLLFWPILFILVRLLNN